MPPRTTNPKPEPGTLDENQYVAYPEPVAEIREPEPIPESGWANQDYGLSIGCQQPETEPVPRVYGRLNLDQVNDYLQDVRDSSTGDPAAMATTAIKHFGNLLQLCTKLAAAVEYQTLSIQALLDTDLSIIEDPRYTMAGPGYGSPIPAPVQYDSGFNNPGNYDPSQDPAFQAAQQWPTQPQPQPVAQPIAAPQGFGQPWQQVTPEQIMARQQRQPVPPPQVQQQVQPVQDPAYLEWLRQGSPQAQPQQPQYSGPARNGTIIQNPRGGSYSSLLDQLSAEVPPIASGFGGSPLSGGPRTNTRHDRVAL